MISSRVAHLRQESLDARPVVSTERAELLTAFYKAQTDGTPAPLLRARAFAHLLELPQSTRGRRILRAIDLVFQRRDLFPCLGDGAHGAGPVEFFRGHAGLVQIAIGGRERILRWHGKNVCK